MNELLSWAIATLGTVTISLLLSATIYLIRWTQSVRDNHLHHIQKTLDEIAAASRESAQALASHDAHEEAHHEEQVRLLTMIAGKR